MADNSLTPKEEFLLNPVTEHNITDAAIASFETNLRHPVKVEVPIEPVQDLHGYDNPWPAGGGANLFADAPMMNAFYAAGNNPTKSESALTVSFNGKDASVATGITFQENTQYTFIFTLSNTNANTGTNIVITYAGGTFRYIDKATNTNKQTIVYVSESDKTVSGISLVNVGGVTTIYCAESGVFKGVLSASQWTPYSNICPISGWTEANINQIGLPPGYKAVDYVTVRNRIIVPTDLDFNLSDNYGLTVICDFKPRTFAQYGSVYTVYTSEAANATRIIYNSSIRSFIINNSSRAGAPSSFNVSETSWHRVLNSYGIFILDGVTTTYYPSVGTTNTSKNFNIGAANGSVTDYRGIVVRDFSTMGGTYRLCFVPCINDSGVAGFWEAVNGQFYTTESQADISASGEPTKIDYLYNNTISVDWETEAGTVYDGTVTLNEDGSADVVGDIGYIDLGTLSWYATSGGFYSNVNIPGARNFVTGDAVPLCDMYAKGLIAPVSSVTSMPDMSLGGRRDYKHYIVHDSTVTTAADLKKKVTGHYATFYLKTPNTYHFPNVGQLKAFLGTNNIWSDAGNVNVKYLTQNSEAGMEYRGDRALELRRRAMLADAPTIHTTVGSEATSGLASFKSYIKAPVKSVEIPFAPKQDLHGYDHPWPAGGGANKWDEEWEVGSYSLVDGSKLSGQSTQIRCKNLIPVTPSETYYFVTPNASYMWFVFFDENQTVLTSGLPTNAVNASNNGRAFVNVAVTMPNTCHYIAFYTQPDYGGTYQNNIAINYPATITTYVPYSNICPISGWTEANINQIGLPPGYKAVDYVTVRDVVRVPTDLDFNARSNSGLSVISTFKARTYRQYAAIYSVYYSESCNATRIIYNNAIQNFLINNSSKASIPSSFRADASNWHTVINGYGEYTLDGSKNVYSVASGDINPSNRFTIGAANAAFDIRGIVVRDWLIMGGEYRLCFIPCINDSGVAGFWEAVNGKFYTTDNPANISASGEPTKIDYLYSTIIPVTFTSPTTGDPMTVYGGTVTLNADGSADVIRKTNRITVPRDLSSYQIEYVTGRGVGIRSLIGSGTYIQGTDSTRAMCSFTNDCRPINKSHMTSQDWTFFKGSWTSVAEFKAVIEAIYANEELPAFVWYYKNPTTYHFDSVGQLKTFLGQNNFWCDISDDITVKYWNRGFGN